SMSTSSASRLALQQDDGAPCSGGGSTPATGISWGNPVTTGMGSAPPGSCAAGNGSGPSGPGAASLATAARLDPLALATTSLRGGDFRPVQGAIVSITRPGSAQRLAPFTSITDATGYFKVPFLPAGEPFTARAIDTASGRVAQVDGVSLGVDVVTPVQLLFTATDSGPGSPTAAFTITPVPDPKFDGSVYYDFDASASSDDGEIVEYIWYFDGFSKSVGNDPTTRRGFGRNGSYDIRLTVIDDEGKFGTAQQTLLIDDLPYDYWGSPPAHVGTFANGSAIPAETENSAFAITPDGRYVAFSVGSDYENPDADLAPEDTNGLRDVYRKDLVTGELLLVSEGAAGVYTGWEHVAISADGRYVAYTSRLDQDGALWRIHVRDMQADLETIELADINLAIGPASLSADGRTLLYAADYSLSDPTAEGAYVRDLDGGTTDKLGTPSGNAFVLAITPSASHALVRTYGGLYVVDLDTDAVTRADTNAADEPANAGAQSGGQSISADGRYVVFVSEASNLVPEPTSQYRDHVFLKDMETGEVTLVTKNPKTGDEADQNANAPVITWDGRYVFFPSWATNLTPLVQAPGPEFDGCSLDMCPSGMVYAYEVATERVALAEVGFDHTTPCCYSGWNRLIAVADAHVAFSSYNEQLIETGEEDVMRVFRAENPLWTP
ncbi:MAG: PKD domain-containing protein, partial [Trueperaceae bacterium]